MESYADTIEPGPNGRKTMIGENTLFPVGLFSDDEDVKDVVQIHGTIKSMALAERKNMEEKTSLNTLPSPAGDAYKQMKAEAQLPDMTAAAYEPVRQETGLLNNSSIS